MAGGDLVGEWHFDATLQAGHLVTTPDSSGNGLDAYVSDATVVPGRFDNAFELSSTGTSEAVVTNPGAVFEPADVTVLAWVRRSGSPGVDRYIVAKGARQCNASSYALETGAGGGLVFYIDDGTQAHVSPDAGQSVWDGNWHMVAGTFDGSTVRLYVDGVQVGSGTAAATSIAYGSATTSSDLDFGNY